jgi:glycogen synthase
MRGTVRRVLMTADAVGGVWSYAVELIRALGAYDIEVLLAVLGPKPGAAQMIAAEKLPNCRVVLGGSRLEWMDDPWEDVDATGAWLLEVAAEFQPDLVHLNDYSHALLPWTQPVLVVAHSCVATWWRAVKGERVPTRYSEYLRRVRAALRRADAVVAPTFAFRKQLTREHGHAWDAVVIPNGRSDEAFQPGEKDAKILSAGRLWDEAKNLRLLDDIAPELAWPAAVAGEPALPNVRPFASRSLRKLGQLDEFVMAEELSRAGIYAAPALYEPFGLAVLEAALSGCALVLSDLPTFRESWEGCARFVPPGSRTAWIEALNQLAWNDAERRWFQTRARARALAFSTRRQAHAYRTVYQRLALARAASAELSIS